MLLFLGSLLHSIGSVAGSLSRLLVYRILVCFVDLLLGGVQCKSLFHLNGLWQIHIWAQVRGYFLGPVSYFGTFFFCDYFFVMSCVVCPGFFLSSGSLICFCVCACVWGRTSTCDFSALGRCDSTKAGFEVTN